MEVINGTKFNLHATQANDAAGRPLLIVMAKATYRFERDSGGRAQLADEQRRLLFRDEFEGVAGLSAPRVESDFVPYKGRCDVIVNGHAHSPDAKPVTCLDVGLAVATTTPLIRKTLRVYGDRRWRHYVGGLWSLTQPEPFTKLPVSYGRAFGGSYTHESIGSHDMADYLAHPANLVGRGYAAGKFLSVLDGALAHNLEAEAESIVVPDRRYTPAAFGPLARNWMPRLAYAGTYDERWKQERFPALPIDFDPRYYQCAPPDQQIDYPRGGERIALSNLTPGGGIVTFTLPRLELPMVVLQKNRRQTALKPSVDTIAIDTDTHTYDLTWRASLPLTRSLHEVHTVAAGSVCRRWWRSRVFGSSDCGCGGIETDDDDLAPVTTALDE